MLFKIIPKKLISSITGFLTSRRLPKPLLNKILKIFIKKYNVDMKEALYPISHYTTINEFFTRPLKKGIRPIDSDPNIIVSPVDGNVVEFGKVNKDLYLQVKGLECSIYDLIKAPINKSFLDGDFITIYLSPQNYHRIHTPFSGKLLGLEYSKGALYPVNALGLKIKGLFSLNERLTTFLSDKELGTFAMVKVAALNVGNIKTIYDIDWKALGQNKTAFEEIEDGVCFKKGDEIGRFELGSTVILFFGSSRISFLDHIKEGMPLVMGQSIAKINKLTY